tara:strand:+ start:1249 stop:1752 length:504 start_codon:yes stop_codon:yes gene_type:complete
MDLPQDIINIIYTFNADHREQMKPVLKEIKKTYFIWTYKRCNFYNQSSIIREDDFVFNSIFENKNTDNSYTNIIQCLIEMKEHEIKRHLDFWGNCMCCRRHILDKPRISENEYNYYYDQFSEYIDEKDFHGSICTDGQKILGCGNCNCVCRHFSRWIVRAYTGNHFI